LLQKPRGESALVSDEFDVSTQARSSILYTTSHDSIARELDRLCENPTLLRSLGEVSGFVIRESYRVLAQGGPQWGVRVACDLEVHDF
jgi:hypothetical protein